MRKQGYCQIGCGGIVDIDFLIKIVEIEGESSEKVTKEEGKGVEEEEGRISENSYSRRSFNSEESNMV